MRLVCPILLVLIMPLSAFSQFTGDTIIVYIDQKVEVKIAVEDYAKESERQEIVKALVEFQQLLPQLKDQLNADKADLIKISSDGTATIEAGKEKIVLLNKSGKLSNTGTRDEVQISSEHFNIFIVSSDIMNAEGLAFKSCMESAFAALPNKSSWSTSLYYECQDGKLTELERRNNDLDFLEINLGAGAGLIRSKWVADLQFGVGLGFKKKGMARNPYLSTNILFDFDAENKVNINSFLNLGYRWNLNRKGPKAEMLGVEVGYLLTNEGDLFEGTTFKLGVNWSPAKGVTVCPQMYFTDDLNTAFPAIRIGFGI